MKPDRVMTNQLCNERTGTLYSFRARGRVTIATGKVRIREEWIDMVSDGD